MARPKLKKKFIAEHGFELVTETKCQNTYRSFLHIPCHVGKAVSFQRTGLQPPHLI